MDALVGRAVKGAVSDNWTDKLIKMHDSYTQMMTAIEGHIAHCKNITNGPGKPENAQNVQSYCQQYSLDCVAVMYCMNWETRLMHELLSVYAETIMLVAKFKIFYNEFELAHIRKDKPLMCVLCSRNWDI